MDTFRDFIESRLKFHKDAVDENLDNLSLEAAARHRYIFKEIQLILEKYLTTNQEAELLSVEQAAEIARVSKSTIHRAAKEGKLKGIQVSRDRLFTLSAVLEYVKHRE